MSTTKVPTRLPPAQQADWLIHHIPHRVRAVLPRLKIAAPWALPSLFSFVPKKINRIANFCYGSAIHEGRMSAIRWLVMFVGITEFRGNAVPYRLRHSHQDMRIDRIDGGVLFDITCADALRLASAYKACSQACSHPTVDTNHPKIGEPELIETLTIIVNHLQATIYDYKTLKVLDQVMSEK